MSRLLDRRNAKRVNGLRRDPRTGAGKLAKAERGYGGVLALDFTDNSAAVYDPTTQANVAYSQGVTDGNGNFRGVSSLLTYTSPSNKLTRQADGYIKYNAHNLQHNSENFGSYTASNCVVTTGQADSSGGLTAALVTASSGTGIRPEVDIGSNAEAAVAGQTRAFAVEAKAGTHSYLQFYVDGGSNTESANFDLTNGLAQATGGSPAVSITALGGGWYLCQAIFTMGAANNRQINYFLCETYAATRAASWNPAGTETIYIARGHQYRYPANTDYIATTSAAKYALPLEYSATDGSCLGLLVEEARTNVCLYGTTLDNAAGGWTLVAVPAPSANAMSPTGVANSAWTITEDTSTNRHGILRSATVVASTAFTLSVYAKYVDRQYLSISLNKTAAIDDYVAARFDIQNGTIADASQLGSGAATFIASSIKDAGNGWYRCSVTGTIDDTGASIQITTATDASTWTANIRGGQSFTGTSASVQLWGAQLEAGAFPTSPIVTYGATATRAVDNISIATSAFQVGSSVGSLYAYFDLPTSNILGTTNRLFSLHGTSASTNRIADCYTQSTTTIRTYGSTDVSTMDASTLSDGLNKFAVRYAVNDYASCLNGGTLATDVTATAAPAHTPSTLEVAAYSAGTNTLNGVLKALTYVPRAKTDTELQTDTT